MKQPQLSQPMSEFVVRAWPAFGRITGWHFHVQPYEGDLGKGLAIGCYIVTDNLVGTLDVYRVSQAPSAIPDLRREYLIAYGADPSAAVARIVLFELGLWEED